MEEVRVEQKPRRRPKEVVPVLDEAYARRRILEALERAGGSLTESALKRKVRVPDELYLRAVLSLHREGRVTRVRRGRGYRIWLGGR